MSRQTLAITTISINIPIVMPRVIYDRVRIRKNYFEIPAFLPIEWVEEYHKWENSK